MNMLTDYLQILINFKHIPRHKRTKTFMEIAGYPHYENVCSNILKFYLDPTNEHGLKDLVLKSLMQIVDNDFKFDNDYGEIEIFREYQTLNGNRLDLVLLTKNYAIGIENKIFHYLANDLTDYKETVFSLCFNSKKSICLVLSLYKLTSEVDLKKIDSNNFKNVTYEEVFANIKKNIGFYVNSSNSSYINHLSDFIKSIENLTPTIMENKPLWTFLNNNSAHIQELYNSFNEYINFLRQKVNNLAANIPQKEFAPSSDNQWIYSEELPKIALVHDYTINNYKIAVDTVVDINGWQIQLFGRDYEIAGSSDYLINIMCKVKGFLPKSFEEYETKERLIYDNFDIDTDILIVADKLKELLEKIEKFKKRTE